MARDRASRPEAKPLRLFVAVDVPEGVRDRVQDAVGPWRERLSRARWVPKQNQHVTLKFLGSTWPRLVGWVTETVEAVARRSEPFETRVTGLGAFPSARRARVLWAGLDDPAGGLASLAADLEGALAKEFEPEKRAFTAHLTVARFDPETEVATTPQRPCRAARKLTAGRARHVAPAQLTKLCRRADSDALTPS